MPLTTVPPQVLQTLPKLTEDLEYRFIGDWLILLDVHAHVIADFIEDALPEVTRHGGHHAHASSVCPSRSCSSCCMTGAGCRTAASPARPPSRPSSVPAEPPVPLPNRDGSFKFAVLGDFGTGDQTRSTQLAEQMVALHGRFKCDLVVLVGDNLYGSERPQDFQKKFEMPYKPLLDAGVKFYASLGNHDAREQRFYKLVQHGGQALLHVQSRSRTSASSRSRAPIRCRSRFSGSRRSSRHRRSDWKIVFFHHPLYSSGDRHGSDLRLRDVLEPLFVQIQRQRRAQRARSLLRARQAAERASRISSPDRAVSCGAGNIDRQSALTAKGFDTGPRRSMAAEIVGDRDASTPSRAQGRLSIRALIARRKPTP